MKLRAPLFFLLIVSSVLLQACGASAEAAIATGIAQTQQISALETAAAGGGAAEQVQPAAEAGTPAPSVAFVSVSQNTNCRSGPRLDYSLLTAINAGQQVEVLKTFSNDYAVVKNPNSSGDCWLFLKFANTINFSAFNLPTATQPPTPRVSATPTSTKSAQISVEVFNDFQVFSPGDTCPVTVGWRAQITANGPVTITYRWNRTDGTHTSEETLIFNEFGSQAVVDEWEFDGPTGSTVYEVGNELKILSPIQLSAYDGISVQCP